MKTLQNLIVLAFLVSLVSCSQIPGLGKSGEQELSQFADRILDFSSEYSESPGPWSAMTILGAPDTYPEYGDIMTAWASKTKDGQNEFLTLGFDTAQYVNHIAIYETYNPGAVKSVSIRNQQNGLWMEVYNGGIELNLEEKSRINDIHFPMTDFMIDAVRLDIASHEVSGWNEIDAVSISGMIKE